MNSSVLLVLRRPEYYKDERTLCVCWELGIHRFFLSNFILKILFSSVCCRSMWLFLSLREHADVFSIFCSDCSSCNEVFIYSLDSLELYRH